MSPKKLHFSFLIPVLCCFLFSCSAVKRKYKSGFFVEWNSKPHNNYSFQNKKTEVPNVVQEKKIVDSDQGIADTMISVVKNNCENTSGSAIAIKATVNSPEKTISKKKSLQLSKTRMLVRRICHYGNRKFNWVDLWFIVCIVGLCLLPIGGLLLHLGKMNPPVASLGFGVLAVGLGLVILSILGTVVAKFSG